MIDKKQLQKMKEKAQEGVSVGYHPSNTLENALNKAIDNFYSQLIENHIIIPKTETMIEIDKKDKIKA